jgi:hypothetical protein
LSSNLVYQVKKVLLDERTYLESPTPKGAVSWPVVMLNLSYGTRTLDIFLSFRNNSMAVKIGTEKFGLPLLLDSDIDSGRKELLRAVKKLFPRDKAIQEIPE